MRNLIGSNNDKKVERERATETQNRMPEKNSWYEESVNSTKKRPMEEDKQTEKPFCHQGFICGINEGPC